MRTAARILLAVLTAAWWLVAPAAGPVTADDPPDLSRQGRITDRVGVLGDREAQVSGALDRLYEEQRLQLFVVHVSGFSGRSPQDSTAATAARNGLGREDALLAVATGDRQYAYWVDDASRLTGARLAEVAATAVEPALRENDSAGAAIGAAGGYGAVLSGEPVPRVNTALGEVDPDPGGDGTVGGDLVLPIVLLGAAGAVAAYAYTKRRRRTATRTTPRGGQEGWGPPGHPPLPALDAKAEQALVDTDDAVRTSREELGFAAAQFGDETARPFQEAVAYAQKELTAAFRLRQQLDDAYPEDDATRRRMLEEIVARCSEANRRLDAESEDFDRLRALEPNAPQALAAAQAAFEDAEGRVVSAEATLGVMRERYAVSAAAPVADDVEQARDRLEFATTSLGRAREAVEADDNGRAAVQVRAAEAAVAQAAQLIEAVDRRARELAEAAGKLPGALTDTETDLAEARGLLEGTTEEGTSTATLQGRIARAEAVAAEVHAATETGPYDPIDALRRVEEADAGLDEALAGAREQEQGTRRARALLDRAMLGARSGIGAAADYISTHRGAVGSDARTRLTEAQRRLERAETLAGDDEGSGGDPQTALAEARRADWLAQQAQSLAEHDVRGFGGAYAPGGARGAGRAGGGLGGAVLGGILLGGMPGADRGEGHGGVAGGPGGDFAGGPGRFGGGGTRGRMAGGRF
ncbi:TPM domain-containing protein [Streptomyces sp. NPDC048389]|uniref:TPM domain-containing protein n=1 Tax=Streptomyces sp. NPDC048389 TaxID=3154622 RepID=UPI003455ADDD